MDSHIERIEEIKQLSQIFQAAVDRVDPEKMIRKSVTVKDSTLEIRTEDVHLAFNLHEFDKIFVVGAGKATAKMAKAVEELLKEKITDGIISVKYGHTEALDVIRTVESGHPVPDANSVRAAEEIIKIAGKCDKKTAVLNLISGGGSALLVSPLTYETPAGKVELSLDDIQKTTGVLLSCGAPIDEMNCVRKHLSLVKGGRLARLLYPATQVNLILSDVIGDRLDTIASGLTSPDETTYGDALVILEKYGVTDRIPNSVMKAINDGRKGLIEETPGKEDPSFKKVSNILIGTNYTALLAASERSRSLGYNTSIISSHVTGEAREAAKVLYGIALDIKKHGTPVPKPACAVAGGETTVTVRGSGKGGRNQELALSVLSEMKKNPAAKDGVYFLSASTDGNDGPTDAAGAFASAEVLERSIGKKLIIDDYLKNNDSYNFYKKTGALLKTGPTNTNVCDLQIILVK
jgi:glycerate 2-kinase